MPDKFALTRIPPISIKLTSTLDITIAEIGTNGKAMFPVAKDANGKLVFRMMPVEIDQKLMQEIAKTTDAKYFRATSNQKLQAIYDEINKLETTEIDEKKFYNYDEKYKSFALIAFVLLGIEVLLRNSVFRGIV